MKHGKKFFALALALLISFALSSCGKASGPSPIDGSGYPHTYPRI